MKKTWLIGAVCSAVILAGCGNEADPSESTGLNMEAIGESVENSGTSENEGSSEKEAKAVTESADTKDNSGNAEGANAKKGQNLYEGFKQGTVKAKYTGSGDRSSYLQTGAVLEKGSSYTMEEIIKAIENGDEYSEMKQSGEVQYSEIDCGSDGVKELLADIPFGDEFSLVMILKEINNELVICFDQDSWSRNYVEVKDDGTIESSGSSGAAVHGGDYALVDANGDYKFYYGVEETLTLYGDFYAYKSGTDYAVISPEGLDADHVGVRDYYFEADYEKRDHYYEYFIIDDNYEDVTTDADYADDNPVKAKFTEAGVKTYTHGEIDEMIKKKAAEIGIN